MNSPLVKSKPLSSRLSAVKGIDSATPSGNSWIITSAGFPFEFDTTDGSHSRVGVVVLSNSHEFMSHAALPRKGAIRDEPAVGVESPQEYVKDR